jgi:hypothetical protein
MSAFLAFDPNNFNCQAYDLCAVWYFVWKITGDYEHMLLFFELPKTAPYQSI